MIVRGVARMPSDEFLKTDGQIENPVARVVRDPLSERQKHQVVRYPLLNFVQFTERMRRVIQGLADECDFSTKVENRKRTNQATTVFG